MSRKLDFVPYIPDYGWIRDEMKADLEWRLENRKERTFLGRPLYYRINVQVIMTQECPYHCPFCIERKNPMAGQFDADEQIKSLRKVLACHKEARMTITGGEPGLYPDHVKRLADTYEECSDGIFVSINTSGYSDRLNGIGHINLSINDFVKPDHRLFPGCTIQTILDDDRMNIGSVKKFIHDYDDASSFSFRFMSDVDKKDYPVGIWNEIQADDEFDVHTFRVGDFFAYLTFDYKGKHGRITLGDMYQQIHTDYKDGYSNVIIHPDGRIATNWK